MMMMMLLSLLIVMVQLGPCHSMQCSPYLPLRPLPLDLAGADDVIFDVCMSSPMYLQQC